MLNLFSLYLLTYVDNVLALCRFFTSCVLYYQLKMSISFYVFFYTFSQKYLKNIEFAVFCLEFAVFKYKIEKNGLRSHIEIAMFEFGRDYCICILNTVPDPPENWHLTVKKLPKTCLFFFNKIAIGYFGDKNDNLWQFV